MHLIDVLDLKKQLKNHPSLNADWVLFNQISEREGFRFAIELVQSSERLSTALYSSYLIALDASRTIQQMGLKIADKISIMCWDDCL